MSFSITTRVYVEDTDYGGVVYHTNYIKFMERARTEFLLHHGYSLPALEDAGILIVIHSVQINYLKPAKLNDLLEVTAVVNYVGKSTINFQQTIFNQNNNDCIYSRGEVRLVCIDKNTHRPVRLPLTMKEALA